MAMTRPILKTMPDVLINPVHAFRSVSDASPAESWVYYFWLLSVFALGRISLTVIGVEDPFLINGLSVAFIFFLTILVAGYLFLLFDTYIVNYVASLVGGKPQDHSAFRILTYSATPALLFGWIPVIGIAGIFYSVILEIIGLRELLGLTLPRAILVLVMGVIATTIITLAFYGVSYLNNPEFTPLAFTALGLILFVIVVGSLRRELRV